MDFLGSLFTTPATGSRLEGVFYVESWKLEEPNPLRGTTDTVEVTKRSFLPFQERVFLVLDAFSQNLPQAVIDDAKRIAYDIRDTNSRPHSVAFACLQLSSDMHGSPLDKEQLLNHSKAVFSDLFAQKANLGYRLFHNIDELTEQIRSGLNGQLELVKSLEKMA